MFPFPNEIEDCGCTKHKFGTVCLVALALLFLFLFKTKTACNNYHCLIFGNKNLEFNDLQLAAAQGAAVAADE